MSSRTSWLLSLPLALASLSGVAWADVNITVSNPSFETLPPGGLPSSCGTGCSFSNGAIPGWLSNGSSGQFQPGSSSGNTAIYNYVPDGQTVAYTISGSIYQTVGQTVNVGDTYSLFVYLGTRKDQVNLGTADLLVNGIRYLASGAPPTPGNWSQWTATYTGTAADAGAAITIELNTANQAQGNFDNVSLTSSAAPEPGSYAAILLGLGSVMLVVRSRRAKRNA